MKSKQILSKWTKQKNTGQQYEKSTNKNRKKNNLKIKGSRSHVELSARASYPPSRPLWSSRLRTQSRWQKTYFFVNVIFGKEIITASRVTSLLYGQTRLQNFFTVRQSYWAASSFEKKASPFSCENNCWLDFFENICHVFFFNSTGKFSVSLVFQVRRPDVFDWEEEKRKKQGFWGNSNKKDRNGPQFWFPSLQINGKTKILF